MHSYPNNGIVRKRCPVEAGLWNNVRQWSATGTSRPSQYHQLPVPAAHLEQMEVWSDQWLWQQNLIWGKKKLGPLLFIPYQTGLPVILFQTMEVRCEWVLRNTVLPDSTGVLPDESTFVLSQQQHVPFVTVQAFPTTPSILLRRGRKKIASQCLFNCPFGSTLWFGGSFADLGSIVHNEIPGLAAQ